MKTRPFSGLTVINIKIDKVLQSPNTPSADWRAMSGYWEKVDAIVNGRDSMIKAGEEYLPKFPNETRNDYAFRLKTAKFTNVYRDILEGLAQKPFAHEVMINESAPNALKELAEDVDGRGNHLHVFAAETFFAGINKAVDWILVDYAHRRRAHGRARTRFRRSALLGSHTGRCGTGSRVRSYPRPRTAYKGSHP